MTLGCSVCPELALDEWGQEIVASLNGKRYPFGGVIELTDRCNLTCVHCYINQPAGDQALKARELTLEQVKTIIDQLADAGTLFLTLTGGEVLLRPDFSEIYMYARQRGMLLTLFTNGTLITERIAKLLAESHPQLVEITLYGATKATYEKVTGIPGSFEKCLHGIQMLVERKIPTALKTILIRPNYHELAGMKDLSDKLGVPFRYDGILWPRLDKTGDMGEFQISSKELLDLDKKDPLRKTEWEKVARETTGQPIRAEFVYNCGAGMHSFHIDSMGRMSICTMSRKPSFSLLEMSFMDAWEKLGTLRASKRQLKTACQTCTLGGLCFQCPGWSQAVHDDDETPVDFVCELAHLRYNEVTERSIIFTEEMKL